MDCNILIKQFKAAFKYLIILINIKARQSVGVKVTAEGWCG